MGTAARGRPNAGIPAGLVPGSSGTAPGLRGPFPVRRRPLQAARGAAAAGCAGRRRKAQLSPGHPRLYPLPRHQPGAAEVLKHCTEALRAAGGSLSSRSGGIRERTAAEASPTPMGRAWSLGRGTRTQLRT